MRQALFIGIAILFIMGCSQQPNSRESVFWRWFQANEARVFDFEKDQEHIFDVYLMLDQALGEYDVETKVGTIEFKDKSADLKLVMQPLSALPQSFDRMIKKDSKK